MSLTRCKNTILASLTWGALTLVLLYRAALTRDLREPYAEDGSALILGALSAPWNLLAPVVDGVFIIPRLFAAIATSIDLSLAPLILSFFSAATLAFVAVYGVLHCLSSIAPSFLHRVLLALVIVGSIGTIQVLGFAMCISYVISLFLVLLALQAPPLKPSRLIPLVVILSFSTNSSFIAAPLFLLRAYTTRERGMLLCGILTFAPLPIILALASASASPHSLAALQNTPAKILATIDAGVFYLFAAPMGGGLLANLDKPWRFCLLSIFIASFLIFLLKSGRRSRLLSLGLAGAAVLYIAAHGFGRAYSITGSLTNFRLTPDRFAFVLIPCTVMAWTALLFDQPRLKGRVRDSFFLIIVSAQILTTVISRGATMPTFSSRSWERFALELYAARRNPPGLHIAEVPVNPMRRGQSWGLIRCDNTAADYVRCSDVRGNWEGIVYEIPRLAAPHDN